jgi:hypothetical protein
MNAKSFITSDGGFTPTRELNGTSNAVMHLQASRQGVLFPLSDHLLACIEETILHAATSPLILENLRVFFTLCRDLNLNFHPQTCKLFAEKVRCCGHVITGQGMRFDLRRVQGLQDMPLPQTGRIFKKLYMR